MVLKSSFNFIKTAVMWLCVSSHVMFSTICALLSMQVALMIFGTSCALSWLERNLLWRNGWWVWYCGTSLWLAVWRSRPFRFLFLGVKGGKGLVLLSLRANQIAGFQFITLPTQGKGVWKNACDYFAYQHCLSMNGYLFWCAAKNLPVSIHSQFSTG